MEKFDAVIIGELNVDLILQDLASFPEMGKEKIAQNMLLTMGSASAIFASNLARLGLNVGFAGMLGQDQFAEVVLATLEDRGVNTGGIIHNDASKTGITVVLSFPDNYAMVTYMGSMEDYTIKDIPFGYVENSRHMHLSSFYLQPGLRRDCAELFRRCKEAGLTTSFDPGWDPEEKWGTDIRNVLPFVDVFLPNEQEALFISGQNTVEDALDELGNTCDLVIIKRGSTGVECRVEGQMFRAGTYSVSPIDTTGAGDSFNAGFLFEWLKEKDIRECLRSGSACGALATTKLGGSSASPTAKELQAFLAEREHENILND